MSKYQRALDEIKNMLNDMTQNENDSFKYHYYIKLGTIDLLQELVDKATPKKVVVNLKLRNWVYRCPSCNGSVEHEYCGRCSQALDWSEND